LDLVSRAVRTKFQTRPSLPAFPAKHVRQVMGSKKLAMELKIRCVWNVRQDFSALVAQAHVRPAGLVIFAR
jgi:hypothetical protein